MASQGLTYHDIQYVGHVDSDFNSGYPGAFPSLWETVNYNNYAGSPYSLNGGQNIFAGRSSADVSFLSGPKSAFGIEIGFDRNEPSPYADIPPTSDTMSVTYYLADGSGTIEKSLHVNSTSQFIGYVGQDISKVEFKSLLRTLKPDFKVGNVPGYYSYILFDKIEFEAQRTVGGAVPEPTSFAAWGILVCLGMAARRRGIRRRG